MKRHIKNTFIISPAILTTIVVTLSLGSCGNMPPINFSLQTPYGDASSSKDGSITIAPRAFIIPDRHGK